MKRKRSSPSALRAIEHFQTFNCRLNADGELESLDLRDHKITKRCAIVIADCPRLESITFQDNPLSDTALARILDAAPQLVELDLRSCRRLTNQVMPAVARLQHLQELKLYDTQITDVGIAALAPLKHLEQLNLAALQITDRSLQVLRCFPELRYLNMAEVVGITARGWQQLRHLQKLDRLDLRDARISDAGLAVLKTLGNLTRLYLSGTWITGNSLRACQNLQRLEYLQVINTQIDDAGLAHLTGLQKLKELLLCRTRVTDAAVKHLQKLKGLRRLELESTRFSKIGKESLKQHLPKCKIFIDNRTAKQPGGELDEAYYREHRPNCLASLTTESVTPCNGFDSAFQIQCRCGESTGSVVGYPLSQYNPEYRGTLFIGPLGWKCSSCGKTTRILDTKIHGYAGELSSAVSLRGRGARQNFGCPKCAAEQFTATASFGYGGAVQDLIDDDPDLLAEDFFMSVAIDGVCSACQKSTSIARFETT